MAKRNLLSIITKSAIYLVLIVLFLMVTYPVFWLLMSSIKPESEIYKSPAGFVQHPTLDNYVIAWRKLKMRRFFFNSVLVSVLGVVGTVMVSALAGYAFSRFRFRGSNAIFLLFVMSLALPAPAIMLSEYILLNILHLLNTYQGIILFYMSLSAFAMVMFRNAFQPLPQELVDAAVIDGCGEFRLFIQVLFPLVKPTTATVVIFTYIWLWGDFIWPFLILQKAGQETLMVGVFTLSTSQYGMGWGFFTAGLSIALLPALVIYLIFQRYFVKGLTLGTLKG